MKSMYHSLKDPQQDIMLSPYFYNNRFVEYGYFRYGVCLSVFFSHTFLKMLYTSMYKRIHNHYGLWFKSLFRRR